MSRRGARSHLRQGWRPLYKLFLTLRYLRKRRIAYFAVAAVMLCTAMVLIVMSVMGGFLDQLKRKARGLLGDVIVQNHDPLGFPLYEEFIAEISAWPEIARATPVIYSLGLMRYIETTRRSSVKIVGIRLEDVYEINDFKTGLYYERYYPGTTRLGPQEQPIFGPALDRPLVELPRPGGLPELVPPPVLPSPYQEAFEQAWAAGIRDVETTPTMQAEFFEELGLPPPPGVYAFEAGRISADIPLPGIILGRDLVAQRESDGRYRRLSVYPRGMAVQVTLAPLHLDASADTPIKPLFRYADDSRTGIYEIDSQHVYCDFDLLQKLLLMAETARPGQNAVAADGEVSGARYTRVAPARCSQIQMKIRPERLPPGTTVTDLTRRLTAHFRELGRGPLSAGLTVEERAMLESVRVYTWEESQMHIIAPVERERQLVTTLFGIISLVAAVLVMCILYMIVLQRTRDIGILKSIGGSSGGAALIFIGYGFAIGVVGAALGIGLGYAFVKNINEVQELLAWAFKFRVWDRAVYSFDEIPSTVRSGDMLVVFVAAVLFATVGSLVAAWRAGAMQPVEALRYE